MPYFEVQTSTKVKKEEQDKLYHELARVIELVPGKSEKWVMVHLEDEAKMCFAGNSQDDAACVMFKGFGELEAAQYDMLTAEMCKTVAPMLGVSPERFYVIYESTLHWGWNGGNF